MSTESGLLYKGVGSFYEVLTDAGESVTCKARGLFRKQHITPTVGDRVLIERQPQGYAFLTEIMPRKNVLVRPPVANIDRIFLTVSASVPEPDWVLIDSLILEAMRLSITPVPLMNKIDTADGETIERFMQEYAAFMPLCVSAETGEGLDDLRALLPGCVSCFAGQSAVGKSSLLNALFPDLHLEIGGLSRKTDRGKHTTRHAELLPYAGGAVLDTPGFSLLEPQPLEQEELNALYPEFRNAPFPCRYPDCMHDTEPDCGVKVLVKNGGITAGRYERYCLIAHEHQQRRKHRYD